MEQLKMISDIEHDSCNFYWREKFIGVSYVYSQPVRLVSFHPASNFNMKHEIYKFKKEEDGWKVLSGIIKKHILWNNSKKVP